MDSLTNQALAFNDCFCGTKRIEKINKTLRGTDGGPDIDSGLLTSLAALGLERKTGPLSFPAKVLNPPLLEFKDAPLIKEIPDGSWQMLGKKFMNPSCVYNYGVVYDLSVDERKMDRFFGKLGEVCKKTGMSSEINVFQDWNKVKVPLDRDSTMVSNNCDVWCLFD